MLYGLELVLPKPPAYNEVYRGLSELFGAAGTPLYKFSPIPRRSPTFHSDHQSKQPPEADRTSGLLLY